MNGSFFYMKFPVLMKFCKWPDLGQNNPLGLPTKVLLRAMQEFHEAPLTHEIAPLSQRLGLRTDPADRFLAATAKVLDLTFNR